MDGLLDNASYSMKTMPLIKKIFYKNYIAKLLAMGKSVSDINKILQSILEIVFTAITDFTK